MKTKTSCIISIPMCIISHQKHFETCNGYDCGVGNTLWLFAIHFWQFAPNLINFEPLVSALYHFFLKNEQLGDNCHSFIYKIKPKHFLRFLMPCLVTARAKNCNHFKAICAKFDHFWTVGFSLIWTSYENETSCIISIPMSIRSNQNNFFVFLCLGHSVSDTLQTF